MVANTQYAIEFKNSVFSTNTFSFLALKLFSKKKNYLNIVKHDTIMLFLISIKMHHKVSNACGISTPIDRRSRKIIFTQETNLHSFKKQTFLWYTKWFHES